MPISGILITDIIITLQGLIVLSLLALLARRILLVYGEKYLASRRSRLEPAVLNLLENPDAIEPLGKNLRPFDRGIIKTLLLQLASELRGEERAAMTAAFEQLGYVARELKSLASPRWWQRREAAINLSIMSSKQAAAPLLKAIRDRKREVGLAAIRALGEMKSPESIAPLLEVMEQRKDWSTGKTLEVLVELGDLIKEPVFARIAATTDPRVRALLVQLCGLMKWSEAVPVIMPLLHDRSHEVRISAARTIGSIGDATVAGELSKALNDEWWEVRAQAAKSLGLLQDSQAVRPLEACLYEDSWWVRHNAARALYQIGPEGEAVLLDTEQSPSPAAAGAAAQALAEGRLGVD